MSKYARTYPASGDLSAKEGYCVKMGAAGIVLLATTATIGTEDLVGIIDQGGGNTTGLPTSVVLHGPCKARIGGVLTAATHRYLTTNASGELVAAAAGDTVIAEWLDQQAGAGADDTLRDVFVHKFHWTLDTDT